MFAEVTDNTEIPVEEAEVTATTGDLDGLLLLSDEGNGGYVGEINTSNLEEGISNIVVTAKKEGYIESQAL